MTNNPYETPKKRIHLMASDETGNVRFLASLMVAKDDNFQSKVYEHTTIDQSKAIRFCSRQAADLFAGALNLHGGTIWNVIESPAQKQNGS